MEISLQPCSATGLVEVCRIYFNSGDVLPMVTDSRQDKTRIENQMDFLVHTAIHASACYMAFLYPAAIFCGQILHIIFTLV